MIWQPPLMVLADSQHFSGILIMVLIFRAALPPLISRSHINESWHWRLDADSLPAIVSLQSGAGVYTKHAQEGEMLPSPHTLPQCGKNHGPKNNQACSSLCARNPDESSGIHFLMIESGPDCIIFSIMENITLHHNCNMFQARLYNALMKWACGLGLKSPDKSTGAVCVPVCARACMCLRCVTTAVREF